MQLATDLGPEGRRRRAVGAGEAVDDVCAGVLEEGVSEALETLGNPGDHGPGRGAVAGQPLPRVGDADADVAHLVTDREPLRLAQARERPDTVELLGDEV